MRFGWGTHRGSTRRPHPSWPPRFSCRRHAATALFAAAGPKSREGRRPGAARPPAGHPHHHRHHHPAHARHLPQPCLQKRERCTGRQHTLQATVAPRCQDQRRQAHTCVAKLWRMSRGFPLDPPLQGLATRASCARASALCGRVVSTALFGLRRSHTCCVPSGVRLGAACNVKFQTQ